MIAARQVKDRFTAKSELIGKLLILLFLVKPTLDLLWFLPIVSIGGKPISLLHITGFLVLVYFGKELFYFKGKAPPLAWLFKLFIITNLVSVMVTMLMDKVSVIGVADLMIRMADSYIIFNVAYFSALNVNPEYYFKLVKAISIGAAVALLLNFLSIVSGYEGRVVISGISQRISGLYSDPGVLANVAVYAIVFTVFMSNFSQGKNIWGRLYSGVIVTVALYVIYTGLSRSAFVLLSVFGLIYISIFKKGVFSRIAPPLFLGVIIVIGAMSGMDYYKYVERFNSELEVITDTGDFESKKDKSVDLGRLEHLGSNRGQQIAYMLDSFLKRPLYQMVIGDFNKSPSHSDYFDILSRNGFIGLVLYASLLIGLWMKALKYSLRQNNGEIEWQLAVLSLVLLSMYILYAFPFRPLNYTTISWFMWATLGIMFGAMRSLATRTDNQERVASPGKSGKRSLAARPLRHL